MEEPPLRSRRLFFCFIGNVVLTGLCVAVPELAPGVDTVPGAALPVIVFTQLYIVLAKVFAGLTSIFVFHEMAPTLH